MATVRVIQLSPEQLEEQLKRDKQAVPELAPRALRAAAMHGQQLLATESPVDLGQYKAAWRTSDTPGGAEVENTAPYAGVVEEGARPHLIPMGVVALIADWGKRHGFEDAWAFAMAWRKKVALVGQVGRWIVRDRLDRLRGFVGEEFDRAWAKRPVGGGQ